MRICKYIAYNHWDTYIYHNRTGHFWFIITMAKTIYVCIPPWDHQQLDTVVFTIGFFNGFFWAVDKKIFEKYTYVWLAVATWASSKNFQITMSHNFSAKDVSPFQDELNKNSSDFTQFCYNSLIIIIWFFTYYQIHRAALLQKLFLVR